MISNNFYASFCALQGSMGPMNRELISDISKQTNRKQDCKYLSWDDLERELEPELFSAIVNLARRYGYID